MSTNRAFQNPFGGGRERYHAVRVLERWRRQGFDILICYPSSYCAPANSRILQATLPDGYSTHPLDSEDAITKIRASIAAGMSYRE